MFDFEKLEVYNLTRDQNKHVQTFLEGMQEKVYNEPLLKQLKEASLGAVVELAEGTGRFSAEEKKGKYIGARCHVFRCVSIIQMLLDQQLLDQSSYDKWYRNYTTLSKMLLSMYRNAS